MGYDWTVVWANLDCFGPVFVVWSGPAIRQPVEVVVHKNPAEKLDPPFITDDKHWFTSITRQLTTIYKTINTYL